MISQVSIPRANPIVPPSYQESIAVELTETATAALEASFVGDYYFAPLTTTTAEILFPIVDDATSISVRHIISITSALTVPWAWSSETYGTVLPEKPKIPIMVWQGPFFSDNLHWTTQIRVAFRQPLIKRGNEQIFFYPMGVWKHSYTPGDERVINFNISIPPTYVPSGVWLDNISYPDFEFTGSSLHLGVSSVVTSLYHDLIIKLVPRPDRFCVLDINPGPGQVRKLQSQQPERGPFQLAEAVFSEDLLTTSVNANTFHVIYNGPDGVPGTIDDARLGATNISVGTQNRRTAYFTMGSWTVRRPFLPYGRYRIVLGGQTQTIMSASGRRLDGEFNNIFPSGNGNDGGVFQSGFRLTGDRNSADDWLLYR